MDHLSLTTLSQVLQGRSMNIDSAAADVAGISIDSRTVQPGDLFFAIQGKRQDGHQFVGQALSQGATACVVKQGAVADDSSAPLLVVDNVNQALAGFAHWYRRQQTATVIGVTGSIGKTTTRNMIHSALAPYLKGVQSPANYNNEFGVPLSIAQLEKQHQYAVLELGASQTGEIRKLAQIASPEIGVISGIGPSHLEHFGTLQCTAEAKAELFEQLPASGLAIVNGDDRYADFLVSRSPAPAFRVGLSDDNDLRAAGVHRGESGLTFHVEGTEFVIPVVGKHFVYPALIAIAVGKILGLTSQELSDSLRAFQPVRGRCHVELIGDWTVVDDAYNSSPVSMRAACELLSEWPTTGKRVLVMGDMLELGPDSASYHYEIGKKIAGSPIEWLFVCGEQATAVVAGAVENQFPAGRVVQGVDIEEIQAEVYSRLEPGDVVLVKGSRGMRMERLIDYLQQQVSEQVTEGEKNISCV
ncbi:UDP-N-acetylmuramoyl-tripeptide--D-alanyl-D-alanine ligase MurF [Gimesia panareensis]|uniref:UDP-N-acetylmuramoyl-tripeptide--D-alanyl-D-alanine ligase n=1 Tax=Gimesia panareensis TaxID=2527978 RepID=A0A517Q638_9PLAN|nr:UDP-N-acetylmuramoyl-tripeptide--D-alanyl-D-alanine ligase [Gimesia panareensis]QDT27111.1 UDP-N-acetylmuramoyl-tripeptide--D-alanyl-D-alanine ligase MurF [Gimesia panareensis]